MKTTIPMGQSIVGYKAYRNTTGLYAGGSASILGKDINFGAYMLFMFHSPASKTGTLTSLFLGLYTTSTLSLTINVNIGVWNESIVDGVLQWERVYEYVYPQYIDIPQYAYKTYEIPISIPIIAGQILSIKTTKASDNTNTAYIYICYNSSENYPVYRHNGDFPAATTLTLPDLANNANYDIAKHLSVELIGTLDDNTWEEVDDAYSGRTEIVAYSGVNLDLYNIDLGCNTIVNYIQLQHATNNDIYDTKYEILISTEDTATPSDASFISVYDGHPYLYGSDSPYTTSPYSVYLGFPFTCRHIRINKLAGLANCTIIIYRPTLKYDGAKIPKSVSNGDDYLTLDANTIDTMPYWYTIVPVDSNGNRGDSSIPFSNRHNIS